MKLSDIKKTRKAAAAAEEEVSYPSEVTVKGKLIYIPEEGIVWADLVFLKSTGDTAPQTLVEEMLDGGKVKVKQCTTKGCKLKVW